MDTKLALSTAKNPDCSPEQLDALHGHSEAVDRLLAKHPKASTELLEKLSRSADKTTRKYVAINPNAAKPVLLALATQFPGDFFKNPAFDWLLLEDPDLLFKLGHGVLKNILKRPDCPESFMAWAIERGDEQQRLAVAMNPQATDTLLRQLVAQGGEPGKAAANHVKLQQAGAVDLDEPLRALEDEVKASLAELSWQQARALWVEGSIGAAQWPWLSLPARIDILALETRPVGDPAKLPPMDVYPNGISLPDHGTFQPNFKTLAHVIEDRRPDNLTDLLISCLYPKARASLEISKDDRSESKEISSATLDELALSSDPVVRSRAARNSNASNALLEKLSQDWNTRVRTAVAENSNASASTLRQMALDKDPLVRGAVAMNRTAPVETLELLSFDDHEHMYPRKMVAANPTTPLAVLARLMLDENESVRNHLARNPSTPADILEQLGIGKERGWAFVETRSAVARHKNAPAALLVRLALDGQVQVREAVARRSDLAVVVLEKLALDKSDSVRSGVAQNQDTPSPILEKLALDPVESVRSAVASNANTPLPVLERLAGLLDGATPLALARNLACPSSLARLAAARQWRQDIAKLAERRPAAATTSLEKVAIDDSLVAVFENECEQLVFDPLATISASLIGASAANVMALQEAQSRSAASNAVRAVSLRGLSHSAADPDLLIKKYRSTDWAERLAVACNPGAPSSVIAALMKDPHRLVALQAAKTEKTRADHLA
jgi:hypothetical protein